MRNPASVFAARTAIVPRARSTSRQRRDSASPIRRPAKVSVASSARRWPRQTVARLSRSPAASSSAAMWSARSSHDRRGATAGRRRLLPCAGLRSSSPRSACSAARSSRRCGKPRSRRVARRARRADRRRRRCAPANFARKAAASRGHGSPVPRRTGGLVDPWTRRERKAAPRGRASRWSRAREDYGHPGRRELSRPGGRRYVHRRRRLRLRVRADARRGMPDATRPIRTVGERVTTSAQSA